jgi:hypothetical protein
MIQEPNYQSNFLSDKKGANELSKKLKPGYIQVIANFQIYNFIDGVEEEPEKMFPRLTYLKLNESLIQVHLEIFDYLKPLFTQYLEHKEGIQNFYQRSFSKRKNHVIVPNVIKTISLWNQMTLS